MPEPFEIHVEPDEGFSLDPVREWKGLRVRYRSLGQRGRYSSFLLETAEEPTLAVLQMVCAKHEQLTKAGR